MRRTLIVVIVVIILMASPIDTTNPEEIIDNRMRLQQDITIPSSDTGVSIDTRPTIVLEMTGGDVTPHGDVWSQKLNASGIVSHAMDVNDILSNPDRLDKVTVMLVDASVGSGNGTTISQEMINLLIRRDISMILTGRSAWILHRLRDIGPPFLAAPATTVLLESAEFAGAAFMGSPNALTVGTSLTSETGIAIPADQTQTELSRLVELTRAAPSSVASLRYDSVPLDVFLFTPEDPTKLTITGQDLLENIIAFSFALREAGTATTIANQQTPAHSLLEGGFRYQHEPSVASTYYAVHAARSLHTGSQWTMWVAENNDLVQRVLETLVIDFGSETGFRTSVTEGAVNCMSTAQGFWLATTMNLTSQFAIPEILAFLDSRQDADGGFENDLTTVYHVTESLYASGDLSAIDTTTVETWLRSLVIDGGKTSNPDLWGSIGSNPTSLSPTNDNAVKYLRALSFLGKAHPDPVKLTSWILTRTANGDGSFRNSQNPDEEIVTGTSSAISSMQILGTLSTNNRTSGLAWFSANQLDSGGFGMKPKASDLVGKTRESSRVSTCLNLLSETSGGRVSGLISFLSTIRTDVGFEGMDFLPSLMWSSWMLSINRLLHSSGTVDTGLAESYLNGFGPWTQYPTWGNITALVASEYLVSQYRIKSVWTQYFGTLATHSLGMEFSPDMVSETTLYLSQAQYMTGHYRPTSLMGLAHVQHSVAAIETLFLLNELDTIPYRVALESAMLSEYSSGSWDSMGWTLEPFVGSQEAIDFLSTRAALRLGIVTPAMATEIAATVQARIQYTDLFALSCSVATLSLLNTSSFSVDLESIDRSQVLSALWSSSIAAEWYNSSFQQQPIFTEGVLKMVSILGLRPSYLNVSGHTLTTSVGATVSLGSDLDVDVTITSAASSHSVMVYAFTEWTLFENVLNSDTLSVPVPASASSLGQEDVFVIVTDRGLSRAFDFLSIDIDGVFTGSLNLDSSIAKIGELINGSVDWSISGIDAGNCNLTIRLEDPLVFNEWTYDESSPFMFQIPTSGFDAGVYNLSVTIERQFCSDLVLTEEVTIVEPNPTSISAPSYLSGGVDEELLIDWNLQFEGNSTQIAGQVVSITVMNTNNIVVFTDVGISQFGGSAYSWIPSVRGEYTFEITFLGNQSLEGSLTTGSIDVFETPIITIELPEDPIAPTTRNLIITIFDNSSTPLEGVPVHCLVTLNGSIILNDFQVTLADGSITLVCGLDNPGQLILTATVSAQSWLLYSSVQDSTFVNGATSLSISIPGQPVEQGSIVGVVISLVDWSGSPLRESDILVLVQRNNGTIFQSFVEITDDFGICTIAQEFNEVGDFVINATYSGYGLNVSATHSVSQRVLVTPNVVVIHDPSCIVGDTFEIQVCLIDPLGNYIIDRPISITIEQDSSTVFEILVSSIDGLLSVQWNPSQGGLATISVLHEGDVHYLTNSTTSVASIMEHVTAELWLDPSQMDLFDSILLVYNLTSGLRDGITIHFEVLGMDLVPVWGEDVVTNASGIATAVYYANHSHGVLRVSAGPTPDQFLIGGDKQELLIVMTDCTVAASLEPAPPAVDVLTNITILITDELGASVEGLTVTVSLFDPYSEQVKLGHFTMSVAVTVVEGLAIVEFTPEMIGLYTLVVSSSGTTSIHSFTQTDYQTVYSRTQLQTSVSTHELEVGEILNVVALLADHDGNPLVGRNLTLTMDGPGPNFIGPFELITDATGHIDWSSMITDEGSWILDIAFAGLGVYLPVDSTDEINVRYGTVVELDILDTGQVIAVVNPASFSLLLRDSGGTPLEGFTIHYEAYHETQGLVIEDDIIQTVMEPMILNLTFDIMGNYTIIVSFAGTSHYHASNSAIQLWVLGTTEVSVEIPVSNDRSANTTIPIIVIDELGDPLVLSNLSIIIQLIGPHGPVNFTKHFTLFSQSIDFSIAGLPVGSFTLNVTVNYSGIRVGCISITPFSVTSTTTLSLSDENLTGSISELHAFNIKLRDSLDEPVESVNVWVSVFNPTGREIFGSPLTDRTSLVMGSEVSWTPTLVGVYRIFLEFDGNAFLNSTTLEFQIEVRYPSYISLDIPELIEFGEVIPVTVTLNGALGTISGATVTLTVITDGLVRTIETLTTGSRGVASVNLAGLLSGTHKIRVAYNGSSTQAPCDNELEVMITPLVVLSIEPISELHVGHFCSINLTVSILGTSANWTGTLDIGLYDPDGQYVTDWTFNVGVHAIKTIGFNAQKLGIHTLNVTLGGLPIIVSHDYPMAVVIVDETLQLELDAGTTPLLGGFGILTIVGVVLRKKIRGVVGSLPEEWTE